MWHAKILILLYDNRLNFFYLSRSAVKEKSASNLSVLRLKNLMKPGCVVNVSSSA